MEKRSLSTARVDDAAQDWIQPVFNEYLAKTNTDNDSEDRGDDTTDCGNRGEILAAARRARAVAVEDPRRV
jgi:hypothetical protein